MKKISEVCLLILTTIAITFALTYAKSILIPFIFALFIYFSVLPMISIMTRKLHISRNLSIALTLFLFTAAIFLLGAVVFNSLEGITLQMTIYKNKILTLAQNYEQSFSHSLLAFGSKEFSYFLDNIPAFSWLKSATTAAVSFVSNLVLVSLFFLFLILGKPEARTNSLLDSVQEKVSRYVTLKFLSSLVTGLLCGLILFLFNVELAFLFGLLTFLLNFVPNVGSIVAIILTLPILLLNFGFSWQMWLVLTLLTFVQFLIGNILEPKILGDNMELHPITVLMFLIFWGLVWGLPGMFLAVPITAIIKIILTQIGSTRKVADLMAGKFPY